MASDSSNSPESAVPAPVRQLIEVFDAHLADLQFPGVTAALLNQRADETERTATALAAAEAVVNQARREHADAYGSLKMAAERGIGYARVYASDDAELLEQLEAIDLQDKARRRRLPPKRKERKPRAKDNNVAELPLQAGNG